MDEGGLESVNSEIEQLQEIFEDSIYRCQGWGRYSSTASSGDLESLSLIKHDLDSMSSLVRQLRFKSHSHRHAKEALLEELMRTREHLKGLVGRAMDAGHSEKEALRSAMRFVQSDAMSSDSDSDSVYERTPSKSDSQGIDLGHIRKPSYSSPNVRNSLEARSSVQPPKEIAPKVDRIPRISPASVLEEDPLHSPPPKHYPGRSSREGQPTAVHRLFSDPMSTPQQEFMRGYHDGGKGDLNAHTVASAAASESPPAMPHHHFPSFPGPINDGQQVQPPVQGHANIAWWPSTNRPLLELGIPKVQVTQQEAHLSGDSGLYTVDFSGKDMKRSDVGGNDDDGKEKGRGSSLLGAVVSKCIAIATIGVIAKSTATSHHINNAKDSISDWGRNAWEARKRIDVPKLDLKGLKSSIQDKIKHRPSSSSSAPVHRPIQTRIQTHNAPSDPKPESPKTTTRDFDLPQNLPQCYCSERKLATKPKPAVKPPANPKKEQHKLQDWDLATQNDLALNVLTGRG
mmetsp:Transcript_35814/g.43246  ORF Transcript_35814/g.43246 Transcript_35814/m.43246 type:complete len:513 (-) Transcript_35814:327-1865(-)|eukprot:CAMPEP_0197849000 /NCGR_PEP_ID=MMETSP1438-20131217/10586_1 /TAXON_ID=1461541 /ORGANISM="Pterosperma sp., Strain CCMP1384" /LENGTH=512 /DNA_ID=CAMNT_0043461493 /DNA_START=203 /DNA_END=1741 /DNA_ORIENTATION=-